jgi:hypothetical protein
MLVSKVFFAPKPGMNMWQPSCDFRYLDDCCIRKRIKIETLLGARHLIRRGDYMFSFDF